MTTRRELPDPLVDALVANPARIGEVAIEQACSAVVERSAVLSTHRRTGAYVPGGRTTTDRLRDTLTRLPPWMR